MGNKFFPQEKAFMTSDKKTGVAMFTNSMGKYEFVLVTSKIKQWNGEAFYAYSGSRYSDGLYDYIDRIVCCRDNPQIDWPKICSNPETGTMLETFLPKKNM